MVKLHIRSRDYAEFEDLRIVVGRGASFLGALCWVASLILSAMVATPAHAQWTPPANTLGWCTVVGAGTEQCSFADANAACSKQHDIYGGGGALFPARDYGGTWRVRACQWQFVAGASLPGLVEFKCASGYSPVYPQYCTTDDYQTSDCSCSANNGGNSTPHTPFPIDILTGGKSFEATDFATVDGAIAVMRQFSSRPAGAAQSVLIGQPLGFANWSFGLNFELQLGADWDGLGNAGLVSPAGGFYIFTKSGTAMVPYSSTAYPLPRTDYRLEFVGSWPSTLSALKTAPSNWIVHAPDDRTWYLTTFPGPNSVKYDVARPTRMVEPGGLELSFAYDGLGALGSVQDSNGRSMSVDWIRLQGQPRAIGSFALPDGTKLLYVYEALSVQMPGSPDRLIAVERRDASSILLDKTTYEYSDARFPLAVTAIRDKDATLRWSVTYDDLGRALTSTGPSGTEAYSVAYGASGSTFNRTVTGPLGKSTVYNFTRTSTNYDVKLASVVDQVSTNSPARTRSMTYGGSNFLATTTDGEGRVSGYTRDARGRPTQITEAQGTPQARSTSITWHSTINAPTQIVAPGLTTDVSYVAGTSAGPYTPTYIATQAYGYSGGAATYTVPTGASSATVELWGAAGGSGNYSEGAWSGAGGYIKATFAVAPGDILTFEVGGGGQGGVKNANGGAGGWPDGGPGAHGDNGSGGGGASTRFYINSVLKAVAGGGGGSGGWGAAGQAGAGGGATGQNATGGGGTGGSPTAGGVDSSQTTDTNKTGRSILAFPGAQQTGGWGSSVGNSATNTGDDGGGGGGGYWGGGGGGGDGQSGGGGSSWVSADATAVLNSAGILQNPVLKPAGQPTVATGVNSANNGPAVTGGPGYATLGVL